MFDFPNYTYSAIVGVFAAIFGMCYPLLLQAIERINDKYNSSRLSAMFLKEKSYKCFQQILYLSIAFSIASPFILSLSGRMSWLQVGILVSAALTILALMYFAVRLFQKIIQYYDANTLWPLTACPGRMLELLDIAIFAAKKNNVGLYNACMQNLWRVLYDVYQQKGETEEYSMDIREILQKLLELSYRDDAPEYFKKDTMAFQLHFFEGNTSGIEKRKYQIMWKTLIEHIKRNNEDWLLSYWEYADQHFSLFLHNLTTDDAERQQAKYKEYHIALGALILYNGKYRWLKKMRHFTNSEPPHYYLVPCTFDEILGWLFHFAHILNDKPFELAERYPLGKHDGIRTENVFYKNVVRYLAYSLLCIDEIDYNVRFIDPKQIPLPFTKDSSKKGGQDVVSVNEENIRCVNFLKLQVTSLNRRECRSAWHEANNLIDQYISKCQEQINDTKTNKTIDKKKVKCIKENLASEYNSQIQRLVTKKDSMLINGEGKESHSSCKYILDNNDIFEGTYRLSINLESIIIASICQDIQQKYYHLFLFNKPTNTFVIRYKDIEKALENLRLTKDYFVVSMNLSMEQRFATKTKAVIKDISVSHSEFIIMKKEYLPYISFVTPNKDSLEGLSPLSKDSCVLSNLSSLNGNKQKLEVAVHYEILQAKGVWKYVRIRITPEITDERFDVDNIKNIQNYIV